MSSPESPCTGVCKLDARDVCRGCGRLLDEIVEWPGASAARRHEIIAAARARLEPSPEPGPSDPP
ncbi:MAG: DUF1289 domain-containing protein [Nevskiaceae bacterium]